MDAEKFFYFWLFMQLQITFCTFLGQALAAICPNEEIAQIASATTAPLDAIFVGFMISPTR